MTHLQCVFLTLFLTLYVRESIYQWYWFYLSVLTHLKFDINIYFLLWEHYCCRFSTSRTVLFKFCTYFLILICCVRFSFPALFTLVMSKKISNWKHVSRMPKFHNYSVNMLLDLPNYSTHHHATTLHTSQHNTLHTHVTHRTPTLGDDTPPCSMYGVWVPACGCGRSTVAPSGASGRRAWSHCVHLAQRSWAFTSQRSKSATRSCPMEEPRQLRTTSPSEQQDNIIIVLLQNSSKYI